MRLHLQKMIIGLIALAAAGLLATAARAAAPTNTTVPTITGTLEQGRTITATRGTWANGPTSFTYQWARCTADGTACSNIAGASHRNYILTSADVDHSVKVTVTASNADGQASASSKTSDVVSDNVPPKNTTRPTISGTPQPAEELTASPGRWTGGARTFAYQWQRCDSAGAGCVDVTGATGRTYGVRTADVGHTMRVVVTATNLAGPTSANSDNTAVVHTASTPPPTPAANHRPTIVILSVRFVGARVYVRFRACDDSRRNVSIIERDSKSGVPSYTRRFRTLVPPRPCAALTRSWLPAPRFRHGRYTLTLTARDAFGLTSLRPARRSFVR